MNIIRWILLVPLSLAIVAATLAAGLYVLERVEADCPIAMTSGGVCNAAWQPDTIDTVFAAATALAAFLGVLCAGWLAPRAKTITAGVISALGAIAAALYLDLTYAQLLVAAAVGAALALLTVRLLTRPA